MEETQEHPPLQISIEVSFGGERTVLSRSYIPQEEWDKLSPSQRQDEIQDGLTAMSGAVMGQIGKNDLTV